MKKIHVIIISTFFLINVMSSFIPILTGQGIQEEKDANIEDCCCDVSNPYDFMSSYFNDEYRFMRAPIDCSKLEIKHPTRLVLDNPNEFNWRDVDGMDWTTIAKHQGNCGSCWDFAALGALESVIMIEEQCNLIQPDLAEQYALSCLPASANNYGQGCLGGTPYKAYFYIMDEGVEGNYYNGIIPESCFPYEASHDIPCEDKCEDWIDQLIPITDCQEYFLDFDYDSPENREILKSIVYSDGPVAVAMNVTSEFVNYWNIHHNPDDYYPDTHEPWGNMLNHIVVICGWKDDASIENGGYWIVKNSWGTDWGYDGFFNLEYGGLFIGMYYSTVTYDPDSVDWDPIADAGGLYQAEIGEIITFDGTNSIDPEGEIASYEWDFGDENTGNGPNPTHSYSEEGIYAATLTVTDSQGNTAEDIALVGIGEEPIIIDASGIVGIKLTIENPLDTQLTNLEWNADITGLVYAGKTNGIIPLLSSYEEFVQQIYVIGIGLGTITFNVENVEKTEKFIIIGPFVFGLNLQ